MRRAAIDLPDLLPLDVPEALPFHRAYTLDRHELGQFRAVVTGKEIAAIGDDRVWSVPGYPEVEALLNLHFGPDYLPRAYHSPLPAPVQVAHEVARFLGAVVTEEYVEPPRDEDPDKPRVY